jgi:hypothetical protein
MTTIAVWFLGCVALMQVTMPLPVAAVAGLSWGYLSCVIGSRIER